MKYYISAIFFIMYVSCKDSNFVPEGYTKYQTFDEYTLKGVPGNTEKIESPYVYVKEGIDTISVMISNKKNNIIQYINKGNYWYSLGIRTSSDKYSKTERTLFHSEKFIFGDTILKYNYTIIENKSLRLNHRLTIDLQDSRTIISMNNQIGDTIFNFNENDKLLIFRNFIKMHNNSIPYYDMSFQPQSIYYESFIKVFKDDRLYLYESYGTDEPVCLSDVFQLSSLGEFDRSSPKSIMRDIGSELQGVPRCK